MKLARVVLGLAVVMGLGVLFFSNTSAAYTVGACPSATLTDYAVDTDTPTNANNFLKQCTNIAPYDVRSGVQTTSTYVGWTVQVVSWLSPVGNPTATSVTVDAGTTSVQMQVNVITYRMQSSSRVAVQSNILSATSGQLQPDGVTVINNTNVPALAGTAVQSTYPTSSHLGYYRIMNPVVFTLPLNPAIKNDQTYRLTRQMKAAQTIGSAHTYQCTYTYTEDPNGDNDTGGLGMYPSSVPGANVCTQEEDGLDVLIKVRSAWTTTGTTELYTGSSGSFSLAASGGASTPNVNVGTQVYWDHKLSLDGTVKDTDSYTFGYEKMRTGMAISPTLSWKIGGDGVTHINPSTTFDGINTATSPYTIQPSDVGKTICESFSWSPKKRSNSVTDTESTASSQQCLYVPYNYTLQPMVSVGVTIATPGQPISFGYSVGNPGGTITKNTGYIAREVIVPPGAVVPANYFTLSRAPSSGCSAYTISPGITCQDLSTYYVGSVTFDAGITTQLDGTTHSNGVTYPIPDSPSATIPATAVPGTRVCRVLSVAPRDQSGNAANNADSALACVLVAASPYVSIVGGDSWSGGSTDAATGYSGVGKISGSPVSTFGSFGEYGLFSTGPISDFGSAGQLAQSTLPMANGTRLTFANTPSLGSFSTSHVISTYGSAPTSAPPLAGVKVLPDTGTNSIYRVPGGSSLRIQASSLSTGTHLTIYAPNNDVHIEGNITYNTTGVTTFAGVPSLTIVAKNITILGSVTDIAGNFFASSSFVTCEEGPQNPGENGAKSSAITSLPTAQCNHQLVINGAVTVANQAVNSLVFNRSSGGAGLGQPAEVIRMRPEVFLSPYEASAQPGSMTISVVQETELPPRY